MTQQGKHSRREFSRYLAGLALGAGSASPFALQLAAMSAASAQTAGSYKALVCIFLFGGNDAHNAVLATDADTFGRYFSARNVGSDQIALMPVGTAPQALGAVSPFNGRTVTRATPEFWGGSPSHCTVNDPGHPGGYECYVKNLCAAPDACSHYSTL